MTTLRINSVIGGVFGLLFVLLSVDALDADVAWVLRAAAVLAFVGLLMLIRRSDGRGRGTEDRRVDGSGLVAGFRDRGYRLLVVAEVVALGVGIVLLRGPLRAPHAVIGWVALVVGVHFMVLARVWHASRFSRLGAVIIGCAVVGLVTAAGHGSAGAIAVIAGVVPGVALLASVYIDVFAGSQR